MIRCTTCRKFHVIGFDYGHDSTNTLPRRDDETLQEWVDRFMADAKERQVGGMPQTEWRRLERAHLEAGTGVNDREY